MYHRRAARHLCCALALGALLGAWMCWAVPRTTAAQPVPFARASAEWDGFYDAWEST
jgi:hypothetical protein